MTTTQEVTVAEIAASSLAAVKVFEKLGIDYCCGGKRPLAEVCVQKGYNPAEVQRELETAMSAQGPAARDWNSAPLTELIDHIVGTHHEYLKREMPPLQARLDKVYRVYNERNGPTLTGLPEVYGRTPLRIGSASAKRRNDPVPSGGRLCSGIGVGSTASPTPLRHGEQPDSPDLD